MKIRSILCPTDFSPFSVRALQHAAMVARWHGAVLTVAHVYPFMTVGSDAPYFASGLPLDATTRARLLNDLEAAARPAQDAGVKTLLLLLEGDPAEEILRRARTVPTDLVVMGTHGRRGLDRWILGSVAGRVVQRAGCPVLTVPEPPEEAAPEAVAGYENILCAVELTGSEHTIETAVSMAEAARARLTVLHVLERIPQQEALARVARIDWPAFEERLEQDARDTLCRAVGSRQVGGKGLDAWVVTGRPDREILKAAHARGASLVVMGIHGSHALDRLFVGSTTTQVLRQARCPVLTVFTPDRRPV